MTVVTLSQVSSYGATALFNPPVEGEDDKYLEEHTLTVTPSANEGKLIVAGNNLTIDVCECGDESDSLSIDFNLSVSDNWSGNIAVDYSGAIWSEGNATSVSSSGSINVSLDFSNVSSVSSASGTVEFTAPGIDGEGGSRTATFSVGPGGCLKASIGGSMSYYLKLGTGDFGTASPTMGIYSRYLDETSYGPDIYTPAAMQLAVASDFEIIWDANDHPRQILTETLLTDIKAVGPNETEIFQYEVESVGNKVDGVYPPTGDLVSKIVIYNPDAAFDPAVFDRVFIDEYGPDGTSLVRSFHYSWTKVEDTGANTETHTWKLVEGGGIKTTEIVRTLDFENKTKTDETYIYNASKEVASSTKEVFGSGAGDPRILSKIEDYSISDHPDLADYEGDDLTTEYFYYPNDSLSNNAGRLKGFERYDGYWEQYEYDGEGRRVKTYRAYGDSSYGDLANAYLVERSYVETGYPGLNWYEIETIQGVEVGRTFEWRNADESLIKTYRATEAGASYTTSSNLMALVEYDTTTNRVERRVDEQGIWTFYDYSTSGGLEVKTVSRGAPNGSEDGIEEGTVTVEKINAAGTIVEREVRDVDSNLVMDGFEVTVTDDLLRATTTLYEDGTNEVLVYGSNCCSGSISSRTDRKGIQTTYTYDLLGRRLSETRQGITRVTEYDAVGRVLQTSRESGASSQILSTAQYDKAGRVVSRSQAGPYQDGTLVTTSYSYSYPAEGGTVETVTRPDATTEIRTTYIGGQTESVAGTAAAPMKMTYDTFTDGGVSGIAERQIRLREDSENPGEFLETEWQEVRSVMGRQIAVVYPDSAEVTTAYNALGQVSEEVDPDGVTTRYQYDGLGRRSVMAVKTSASAGIDLTADQVTEWEYEYAERNENLFGTAADYTVQRTRTYVYPEDASSARTLVQTTERSTLGIATWTTDTAGAESLSYRTTPAAGDWNEISVQPSGARSIREYDDGLIVREEFRDSTDSLVSATDYTHDLWNRTATSVDSRTGTTTYAYFDNDQPSQVTAPDPDGGSGSLSALVTSYEYDDLGRTTEVTLPDSSVVYTEYTDRGEVAKTWGSQQFPVEYTYDAQGRMATMTTWQDFNPGTGIGVSGDAITIWEYDVQRGWLVRKEYDDGKGTDYTYTDAGRLATRTWERGVVTTYGYDDAGRQTSVDYSDSTDDIAYTYDRLGQPKTITDATGTRTFDYNAELRLETEELDASYFDDRILTRLYQDGTSGTVAGRNGGFSLGIAADPDHDLSVGYSYDSAGRLSTVSDGTDTFTYGYLANTPGMLAETEGPAHTASYTYEPGRNALTIVENEETVGTLSTVSQYSYRYDALGRRTDRVDEGSAFAQASLYDWTYDDRGQVTTADRYLGTDPDSPGASVAAATDSFDYDFIGNRLTSTFGTASQRSYTVDSLNQYTGITNPSAGPAHDVDGNMTYDGVGWYFEWNGENRMIEARNYADVMNPTSGAVRLTFTYDYQGRRVEKTVEEYDVPLASMQTVSEERFVYDGWNLIATYDSQVSGLNLQVSYLWGQDLSGSMQGAGGVGGLLSVTDDSSGDVFYATYDANGNVSEYIDETGGIAAHYEYSSFGRVIASTVLPDDFVFRFSTKYQDNETDLLYYGFRYYVPETGRWLSRDPIGERGGLNLYGFVWNNGLKWWDYLGLAIVDEYYFPESAENISYRFDPLDFDQGGITEIRKSASCDCYFDEEKKCYRVYCQITLELSITINELLRGNDGLIENAYGHEQQHVSRVIAQVRNMASHYRDNHSAVFESDSKCQSDSRGPEYVQRAMRDVLDTIEELHVYHIEPFSPEKGKPYDPINPVPPALN